MAKALGALELDMYCTVTALQVEAMDIMKAVESGTGSHSQLKYPKISQGIWKDIEGID